jgi:hypothetical protein
MSARLLSVLQQVNPREVWTHEERDFTPWLLENGDRLAEALGIDLELTAAEHRVGPFELDLLGRDLTSDAVLMIENQLGPTDHGHLGQLLTYAAGTDAATIVWIATQFGEEHRQAIDWLNERTDESTHFFGVQLEVVRIDDSAPAPNLKVVAAPNDWQKRARRAGRGATAATGKRALYEEFWGRLIERVAAERPGWTRRRDLVGNTDSWVGFPSGVAGARLIMGFARGERLRHELYFQGGSGEDNKRAFHAVASHRETLEREYGRALEFEDEPGNITARIADYGQGDVTEASEHERFIDWFIDSGDRFRRALETIKRA